MSTLTSWPRFFPPLSVLGALGEGGKLPRQGHEMQGSRWGDEEGESEKGKQKRETEREAERAERRGKRVWRPGHRDETMTSRWKQIQGRREGRGRQMWGKETRRPELGAEDEESRGTSGPRGSPGGPSRSPGSPCWWWSPGRCWRQGRCSRRGLCWTPGLRSILTRCLCSVRRRGSRGLCWTPGIPWSPGSC